MPNVTPDPDLKPNATLLTRWPVKNTALQEGERVYARKALARGFVSVTALPPNPKAGERWNIPQKNVKLDAAGQGQGGEQDLPPPDIHAPVALALSAYQGRTNKAGREGYLGPVYAPASALLAQIEQQREAGELSSPADVRKLLSEVVVAVKGRARELATKAALREAKAEGMDDGQTEAHLAKARSHALGEESVAKVLIVAAREAAAILRMEQEGEEMRKLRDDVTKLQEQRKLQAINGGQS